MEIDNTLGNNPNNQIVNPDNQNILPKKKRYILSLLGLIFFIIIVGVGAYYFWTKNNQNKEVPPLTAVQQEMFRSAGVDIETADWKTYTGVTSQLYNGPQGRFSIKYPSTWESEGSLLYPLKENKQTFIELGAGPMGGPFSLVKKTFPAGVANYVWVKEPSNDKIFGRATFLQGTVSYSFNFLNLPIQYDKEYQKIFDLMLSTFKMTFEVINQNQTTDTPNWKTYTNIEYGYAISYPSDWVSDNTSPWVFISPDKTGGISINTNSRELAYRNAPLVDYAKIAAGFEFQSHRSLISIQKVTTNSHLIGYKTKWDIEGGPSPYKTDTITYFEMPNGDTSKTIQISTPDEKYMDIYDWMISTFKFLD